MSRWRQEEGSAIIEFSLIAIAFIFLLLGVVEMGRMVLVYTTVANAARAGARYAIVHGNDRTGAGADGPSGPTDVAAGQVKTVVQNFASAGLLTTGNLTITVGYPDTTNGPGSRVSVTVSYPYDPLIPYFNAMLSQTLSSTSEGVITY